MSELQVRMGAKAELVPERGFNLVGVDDFEEPGDELYLVGHFDTREEAVQEMNLRKRKDPDEVLYVYGSEPEQPVQKSLFDDLAGLLGSNGAEPLPARRPDDLADRALDSDEVDSIKRWFESEYGPHLLAKGRLLYVGPPLEDEGAVRKSRGLFIGPRGGKWADPQHTIPFHEGGQERHGAATSEKDRALPVFAGEEGTEVRLVNALDVSGKHIGYTIVIHDIDSGNSLPARRYPLDRYADAIRFARKTAGLPESAVEPSHAAAAHAATTPAAQPPERRTVAEGEPLRPFPGSRADAAEQPGLRALEGGQFRWRRNGERFEPDVPDKVKMQLVREFAPLIASEARQAAKLGGDQSSDRHIDLQHAATEGLLHAVRAYPGGAPFAIWAKQYVRGYARAEAGRGGGLAMPERHRDNLRRYVAARVRAQVQLGTDSPTPEQVAPFFDLRLKHVHGGLDEARREEPVPLEPYALGAGRHGAGDAEAARPRQSRLDWARQYEEHLRTGTVPFEDAARELGDRAEGAEEQVSHLDALKKMFAHLGSMGGKPLTAKVGSMEYRVPDGADLLRRRLGIGHGEHSVSELAQQVPVERRMASGEWQRVGDRTSREVMPELVDAGLSELRRRLGVQKGAKSETMRLVFGGVATNADWAGFVHVLLKSRGLFIGPRGGKWADPQHTIPFHEEVANPPAAVVPDRAEGKKMPKEDEYLTLDAARELADQLRAELPATAEVSVTQHDYVTDDNKVGSHFGVKAVIRDAKHGNTIVRSLRQGGTKAKKIAKDMLKELKERAGGTRSRLRTERQVNRS